MAAMRTAAYEQVVRLTESQIPADARRAALRDYATLNGWRPSDQIEDYPGTEDTANGHLVVEHGLDNTAVLTFLKGGRPFGTLEDADRLRLLSISYNNLVDWHLFPDREGVTVVYNLRFPTEPCRYRLDEQPDAWRAESFDQIIGRKRNPNIRRLDDALIRTISTWKRRLSSEPGIKAGNEELACLFNGILLVRAAEDYARKLSRSTGQALVDNWHQLIHGQRTIEGLLQSTLRTFGISSCPPCLLRRETLKAFDALSPELVLRLVNDFYRNRYAECYDYDFSLMSKHALSRIYERYVSLLRLRETSEMALFPDADLPEEVSDRRLGNIYTPQFVARFFARVLKENLPPRAFRELRVTDPACGSGIFLRTLLEMQCDPTQEVAMPEPTERAFANILGIDVDANACQATSLSLSLLYLVLMGKFPTTLNIVNAESLGYLSGHPQLRESMDVVIANPPFVKWENIAPEMQQRVLATMGDCAPAKPDLFMAFVHLGMELLRPGGYLLYVVPHSFLVSDGACRLRARIAREYWIRYLVDLSQIEVFDDTGAYVVLLVLEKKHSAASSEEPPAVTVRCNELVGQALQSALEGKPAATDFYDIHEVPQAAFAEPKWEVRSPGQYMLVRKMRSLPQLSTFLTIHEGFITGADAVFVIPRTAVPAGEEALYRPYLRDKDMRPYTVPARTDSVVFYPFLDGARIDETYLKENFPKTWSYLRDHGRELKARKTVAKMRHSVQWWSPAWPRSPQSMLRPKLVSPHLTLMPQFAFDISGKYAVSRSPLMYPKEEGNPDDLLKYFLALLNSTAAYWQIVRQSHTYRGGYTMLEPKTLKTIAVPDPGRVSAARMKLILETVDARLRAKATQADMVELNKALCELYSLTKQERLEIGLNG
ncbi:MAG TPA: N-6 DNA methylase [Planctomycetota bacterium]|nr:N-6 DNA methylase [Planctomycetota bacterium]